MRALLVVNPKATATTSRSRDVLASALGRTLKVDVAETTHRGHAWELGAGAVRDGFDVVVGLGGDGTVNEVVNGLLAAGVPPDPRDLPLFGVVPGGSTNVFTRSLGYDRNSIEATSELLERLEAGRERVLNLGRADDRYFTFCAGMGLDADAVRRVEQQRARGKRSTPSLYVRSGVRQFALGTDRRHPPLRLTRAGHADAEVFLGLICNTRPWTFLGRRPVIPCPDASYATGLDLFALTRLSTVGTLLMLSRILAREPRPRGRRLLALHDATEFTLTAHRPLPYQLDGDALGDRTVVRFSSAPRALRVIA